MARLLTQQTAAELAAGVAATTGRLLVVFRWLEQEADRAQQQEEDLLLNPALWQPSLQLLVECVLLVPTADMASSCLQLITRIMQQVNAALQVANTYQQPPASGEHDSSSSSSSEGARAAAEAEAAARIEAAATAEVAANHMLQSALTELGPAVYHVAQQAASLKQRRQLLRLWANALATIVYCSGGEGIEMLLKEPVQSLLVAAP
jgi:hypothetical protein